MPYDVRNSLIMDAYACVHVHGVLAVAEERSAAPYAFAST